MAELLRPVKYEYPDGKNKGEWTWDMSQAFLQLRKLTKLRFTVNYQRDTSKQYCIAKFAFMESYGSEGITARSHKFDCNGREVTIEQYLKEKYNYTVRGTQLPLVETAKGEYFPLECCNIVRMQRYGYKLDPEQVRNDISHRCYFLVASILTPQIDVGNDQGSSDSTQYPESSN
jgi:eukaryotic translation initiation factor 2C